MPTSKREIRSWKSWITENGSYKLVALFVTLILWVTILGRGDIVMTKEVDLELLLPANTAVAGKPDRKVAVKVSGPRIALKKFTQNPGNITLDLSRSRAGHIQATVSPKNVEVPFGVKVLSVDPDIINLTLTPVANEQN